MLQVRGEKFSNTAYSGNKESSSFIAIKTLSSLGNALHPEIPPELVAFTPEASLKFPESPFLSIEPNRGVFNLKKVKV